MRNGWWSSLFELSRPDWQPNPARIQEAAFLFEFIGNGLYPTRETVEGIGHRFAADWVRWWQLRGKKPARLLREWKRREHESSAEAAGLHLDHAAKLRRLIELAVDQQQPIWVEGDSATFDAPEEPLVQASRPRMFTWLAVSRTQRSVLEVGLDADRNRIASFDRELYLRALHELREEISRSIRASTASPSVRLSLPVKAQTHPRAEQSAERSIATIVDLASTLETARAEMMRHIDLQLATLEGTRLDTIQANQLLAKSLHQLLDSHGFRLRCPECGQAAIMRCVASGNSPTGSFVFDHYLSEGRTFHGGRSSIPKLAVIAKPTRQVSPVR